MLTMPMDVLYQFPVRKTKKQKQAFRDSVQAYAQTLGYESSVEKGSFGCRNLIIGDPKQAKYLVTAHYDTCARLPFPNLITPTNLLAFIGYQLFMVIVIFAMAILMGLVGCLAIGSVCALLGDPIADAFVYSIALTPVLCYISVWILLILMMVGPANKNNANDNTSGVVTVLEIARILPENQRHKVCFVLFDLEEAGLLGSASYRTKHKKATDNQVVLNLDCVGDGDHILLFPTRKLKKDTVKIAPIYKCCGYFGKKSVLVQDKGIAVYPSDQSNFPYGVGIAAFHKGKAGLYLGRIHTSKDTVLDITNVNILRAAIVSMICAAAQ